MFAILLAYIIFSQNLIFLQDENQLNNKINNLTTASSVFGYNEYTDTNYFMPGDFIFIYFEYDGSKTENNFEINVNIEVFLGKDSYYKKSYIEYNKKEYFSYKISTDKTWPINEDYLVLIKLLDNITKDSFESTVNFRLLDEIFLKPIITVLEPASEIRGYQDYDSKYIFNKNNTVYIYEEYKNITIISNENCNLHLEIIVTKDDVLIYQDNAEKTEIGNYVHKWFFTTNSSWSNGLYDVKATLTDKISNKEAISNTYFTLL